MNKTISIMLTLLFIVACSNGKDNSKQETGILALGLLSVEQSKTKIASTSTATTQFTTADETNPNVIGIGLNLLEPVKSQKKDIDTLYTVEKINVQDLTVNLYNAGGATLGNTNIPAGSMSAGSVYKITLSAGTVYDIRKIEFTLKHKSDSGILFTENKTMDIQINKGEIHKIKVTVGKYAGTIEFTVTKQ